mmetsp:Transcript_70338/g.195794  ORF Transcript_70338/g.195794 Transcript_70338/m.195794 type:complete len:231 (-) Transcript_70338:486-1178(-)
MCDAADGLEMVFELLPLYRRRKACDDDLASVLRALVEGNGNLRAHEKTTVQPFHCHGGVPRIVVPNLAHAHAAHHSAHHVHDVAHHAAHHATSHVAHQPSGCLQIDESDGQARLLEVVLQLLPAHAVRNVGYDDLAAILRTAVKRHVDLGTQHHAAVQSLHGLRRVRWVVEAHLADPGAIGSCAADGEPSVRDLLPDLPEVILEFLPARARRHATDEELRAVFGVRVLED